MTTGGVIAFAPRYNSEGKHDATGAFQPEARRFLGAHGKGPAHMHLIDNRLNMSKRAEQVEAVLNAHLEHSSRPRLVCCAFFCHGYATGIQLGYRSKGRRRNIEDLAKTLARISGKGLILPLYCCSTAKGVVKTAPGGDGGFADQLRDVLVDLGHTNIRIDAHSTVGHTTTNPYVRRFEGPEGHFNGGVGGTFIIEPHSPRWRQWRAALRSRDTDLRYAFPFYSKTYVVRELARIARQPPDR